MEIISYEFVDFVAKVNESSLVCADDKCLTICVDSGRLIFVIHGERKSGDKEC